MFSYIFPIPSLPFLLYGRRMEGEESKIFSKLKGGSLKLKINFKKMSLWFNFMFFLHLSHSISPIPSIYCHLGGYICFYKLCFTYSLTQSWLFVTPFTIALQDPLFIQNTGVGCHSLLKKYADDMYAEVHKRENVWMGRELVRKK